jgi:hypothetical protein
MYVIMDNIIKIEEKLGTIATKDCECCGHHEVGIETDSGEFIALKSGMKVQIVEEVKSDED